MNRQEFIIDVYALQKSPFSSGQKTFWIMKNHDLMNSSKSKHFQICLKIFNSQTLFENKFEWQDVLFKLMLKNKKTHILSVKERVHIIFDNI